MTGKIEQIKHVSEMLCEDCYMIANQTNSEAADVIFRTLEYDVNINKSLMLSYHVNNYLAGFIKGQFEQLPEYVIHDIGNFNSVIIDWLYIDKKFLRMGIAQALLNEYIKHQQRLGADYIFARVTKKPASLKFYENQKFQTIGWNNLMGKRIFGRSL